MITVKAEPQLKRVHIRMGGMLTVGEVAAFGKDERDAVRSMGLRSGEFDLLIETEGNLVQTQEAMDALAG